jgi:P pilus assembly chaperone PapD
MMHRRGICVALGLALALLIPRVGETVGLGIEVTPAKLDISIPAGATYNIPITVHNASVNSVHVQASMADFGVGMDGSYQFQKVGTRPNSLMRWASIRPREFDLAPGTVEQVQLTLQVPQGEHLSGEYAGIVFFQTRPPRGPRRGVVFSIRVASKIYETIPNTAKIDGAVTKMAVTSTRQGEFYRVLFKNTGNVHVYLRGQLIVQKGNDVVEQLQLATGQLVERGGERLLEISGKRLQPGAYQAIATIDYGGKTETGGEIAFQVH